MCGGVRGDAGVAVVGVAVVAVVVVAVSVSKGRSSDEAETWVAARAEVEWCGER